jgi:repressor LexA
MTIGERVAELRKRRSLTQEELARILFVNRSTVTKWETDDREISCEYVGKIAVALNTSCDYLILGKELLK